MKLENRLSLLIDSIKDDLVSLQGILDKILELREKIQSECSYAHKMALALTIHNFYNCVENIFGSIAKEFGNEIESGTWHLDLLKSMKLERNGIRPAVVDQDIYNFLNDLRGFRHIVRHSYSYELDERRMLLITGDIASHFDKLVEKINRFIDFINQEIKKFQA
jgi:uncharacterized protein YutE (UPF0331/DUF86 family)